MYRHKLCIVSPSLKIGGIERALTVLAAEFSDLGIEVHFISCLNTKRFYDLPATVKVYEPSFKRSNSTILKIIFYPRLLNYLRSTVEKIDPGRVLVFGDWFNPIVLLSLIGKQYPIFISDRTIPDYPFKFPIPQLKLWLYPRSAGFIAQTSRAKVFKEKLFKERLNIKVIPNALPRISGNALKNAETSTSRVILYVGRFAWEKDPEILIRAMALVSQSKPDWTLKMAGNGPLLEKMKALVNELGLEEKIIFLGQVTEVSKLYKDASIYVLPSIVEGFPNALIEAMSYSLPCICFSDIPFEDIIVPNINGIVLKERSPEVLSQALLRIIDDHNLRPMLGIEASKVREELDAKKIATEHLEFMDLL